MAQKEEVWDWRMMPRSLRGKQEVLIMERGEMKGKKPKKPKPSAQYSVCFAILNWMKLGSYKFTWSRQKKKKKGEDVKTHKLQQISGCAAAAIKLFKGHVLSCKSLKSEMFVLHSGSLCWAMNICSTMQTRTFSLFVPNIDMSAAGGEFLHCLGSVGTASEGPASSLSGGNWAFRAVTSTVTDTVLHTP